MDNRTSLSIPELHSVRQLIANLVTSVQYDLPVKDIKYWNLHTEELHLEVDRLLRRTKETNLTIPYSVKEFDLMIQYDQTIENLIKAGNYDWVNSDINSRNFPEEVLKLFNTKAYLFNFGKWMPSKDAILEMDKYGFKPATTKVILSFGLQYPNEQKNGSIVGLGSTWQDPGGFLWVPILWFDGDGRKLYLDYFGGAWSSNDRFLAVRK